MKSVVGMLGCVIRLFTHTCQRHGTTLARKIIKYVPRYDNKVTQNKRNREYLEMIYVMNRQTRRSKDTELRSVSGGSEAIKQ